MWQQNASVFFRRDNEVRIEEETSEECGNFIENFTQNITSFYLGNFMEF